MHDSWKERLAGEFKKDYFPKLVDFVQTERRSHAVFPPEGEVFTALKLTPFGAATVVLLGQDPYHGPGQAHGLSFSVKPGVPVPPSLANIYKELASDVGFKPPAHGNLTPWAEQGVLLLNTTLTVRAHEPASHAGRGWETFTDAIIRALANDSKPVVFILWGKHAQKKVGLINASVHTIIQSAHPSPMSAFSGFFGSKPFSETNRALVAAGHPPIDWQLSN